MDMQAADSSSRSGWKGVVHPGWHAAHAGAAHPGSGRWPGAAGCAGPVHSWHRLPPRDCASPRPPHWHSAPRPVPSSLHAESVLAAGVAPSADAVAWSIPLTLHCLPLCRPCRLPAGSPYSCKLELRATSGGVSNQLDCFAGQAAGLSQQPVPDGPADGRSPGDGRAAYGGRHCG